MTTTFAALGVSAPLVEALAAQGITEPFPIQALTIADALAGRDVSVLIWTTTPWTIPSNLAIAFHPEFDYAAYDVDGRAVIVAEALAPKVAAVAGKTFGAPIARMKGEPPPEWTRRPNAKDALRARARELRAQGLDYEEIAAVVGVSKSSVSLWVRDLARPARLSFE